MTRLRLLVLVSGVAGAALALVLRDRPVGLPKSQDDPTRAALAAKETDYSRYEQRMEAALRDSVPETTVAAPPATEHAAVQDPEWGNFPRTSGFVKLVVEGSRLDVRQLFRNRDVNPTDTYLGPADRACLADIVSRASASLSELGTISKEVAADEFDVLVRGGKTRDVTVVDYVASLSPSEKKAHDDRIARFMKDKREALEKMDLPAATIDKMLAESQPVSYKPVKLFGKGVYATRVVEGKILGATLSDLPKAAEALSVCDQRLIQMASDLANIFVVRECVGRLQADQLLAATADALTQRK